MNFVTFGLIVTGRGEAVFLPKLFRSITAGANCTFKVIRKSEQMSPITSSKRIEKMIGTKKSVTDRDEEQYGVPARIFLQKYPGSFVVIVDDLEGPRRSNAQAVFDRYRKVLDTFLAPDNLSSRASVHFLVNMLEAYYFAHAEAVNKAAGRPILAADHPEDVEAIPHPKNLLKQRDLWDGFNEVEDGVKVLDLLESKYVLRNPEHCCWLRTLFGWCVARLGASGAIHNPDLEQAFCLPNGCRSSVTDGQ